MTTAANLITRVRTNINEPSGQTDPLRSDTEILQWLEDGVHDYLCKIPADSIPSLLAVQTFSGNTCSIPTDYVKIVEILVTNTISGSTTGVDKAFVLKADESFLANNWATGFGAWAQFRNGQLYVGPAAVSGTLSYLKRPTAMTTSSVTFGLPAQHEEPVVNYATVMALGKVNDADAERYLVAYNARIQAENGKFTAGEVEPK